MKKKYVTQDQRIIARLDKLAPRRDGSNHHLFTPKELHDRIKRQVQPFPSLLQSAEDERRQALNAADEVEQHGAAESFSEWLDQRGDSI